MTFQRQVPARDARAEAHRIAFGPIVFQCVRIARKRGLLATLEVSEGCTVEQLAARHGFSPYAVRVLLESCLSAGVVACDGECYRLAAVGHYVLNDPMAEVNFDFVHEVCYRGMFELEASLESARPEGLKSLGPWATAYQGLSSFPPAAREAWLAFDHFYSDHSFPEVLEILFAAHPRRVLDIGANTGKFARACLEYDAQVEVTLADLPQQLELARRHLEGCGLAARARFAAFDFLAGEEPLPGAQDLVWMSQFLCCFPESVIASILRRARAALAPRGRLRIMDTFWDRQRHDVAAFCVINTSPYFTAIASGNSKMYRSDDYLRLAREAGLALIEERDDIGVCHTLLTFERS
ncbi:MAG: methyltransferase domain-containing protein [Planctomycetes bacterium]|nr:methyltransferase domain-containing protein [Planctomycetota bacterium]